jgi:hypothetical protein
MNQENWPELSFAEGNETYQTIHLWTQIVGKIKLVSLPWINHAWHVTLLVAPFGLTTGDLPSSGKHFQINFNFIDHEVQIMTSTGERKAMSLLNLSVASFYEKIMGVLSGLGIPAKINLIPNELVNPIPFDKDDTHATYNPVVARNLHTALLKANQVFTRFRADFIGKCSPVHFFWGSFDLAVTRFSGREAPPHPGGIPNLPDWVAQEAYSHEVSSAGFWPGNEAVPFAAFYSYAYPEPGGFKTAALMPQGAYYHPDLGEYILPYEVVQQAANPSQVLLDFLNSTYQAAAIAANWDRAGLEKSKYKPNR